MDVSPDRLEQFVSVCHQTARQGLVRCSSGNFSWRLDDAHLLVSGTRTWLEDITPQQVSLVRLADGEVLNGVRPSVESRFHVGILRQRPEVGCVLHFQSPAATAIACRNDPPPSFDVTLEVPVYVGPVAWVPFHMPGSPELSAAVVAAAAESDLVMMRNHGQVALAGTPREAIQMAVFFESACEVILRNGEALSPLRDDHVRRLRDLAQRGGSA
ncbi:MAG: class II aldolase/adducin family protein [Phycisphaerae bacterium]